MPIQPHTNKKYLKFVGQSRCFTKNKSQLQINKLNSVLVWNIPLNAIYSSKSLKRPTNDWTYFTNSSIARVTRLKNHCIVLPISPSKILWKKNRKNNCSIFFSIFTNFSCNLFIERWKKKFVYYSTKKYYFCLPLLFWFLKLYFFIKTLQTEVYKKMKICLYFRDKMFVKNVSAFHGNTNW